MHLMLHYILVHEIMWGSFLRLLNKIYLGNYCTAKLNSAFKLTIRLFFLWKLFNSLKKLFNLTAMHVVLCLSPWNLGFWFMLQLIYYCYWSSCWFPFYCMLAISLLLDNLKFCQPKITNLPQRDLQYVHHMTP